MTRGADSGPTPDSADRRSALVVARLVAVATAAGLEDAAPIEPALPRGAAVRGVHCGGECWWVNPDGDRPLLGATLAWSTARHDWSDPRLVVALGDARSASIDARRAEFFGLEIEVRLLSDGATRPVTPAAHHPVRPAPAEHLEFVSVITAAGADPVIEHGVVTGEVHGLEVCRVVEDPNAGPTLAVGVGEHDRETFALVHGHRPVAESLSSTVDFVASHRAPGSAPHPINRIAHARLLRARAIATPGLVGASLLAAVEPPVPRTNIKDPAPCLGSREDGSLVCFVSGADLEAVPFLLDALDRSAAESGRPPHAPARPPALALRSRDLLPSIARVAMLSATPLEIIVLPDEIG